MNGGVIRGFSTGSIITKQVSKKGTHPTDAHRDNVIVEESYGHGISRYLHDTSVQESMRPSFPLRRRT